MIPGTGYIEQSLVDERKCSDLTNRTRVRSATKGRIVQHTFRHPGGWNDNETIMNTKFIRKSARRCYDQAEFVSVEQSGG